MEIKKHKFMQKGRNKYNLPINCPTQDFQFKSEQGVDLGFPLSQEQEEHETRLISIVSKPILIVVRVVVIIVVFFFLKKVRLKKCLVQKI